MKHIAGTATVAAGQLREFLLHGPAQQQEPPHAGAVAGTVSHGSVQYVYGEITGYYLHWLASLDDSSGLARSRAVAAAQWLERYLQGETLPATRIYLDAAIDDWRNNALFAFDLAMIAGGLARAEAHGLIKSSAVLPALLRWLEQFVDGDRLRPCIVRDKTILLPSRWSTQGGSFTAKTASRILLLSQQTAVDARLLHACRKMLSTCARAGQQNGLDMLHPTLYAIEGCLLAEHADYEKLAHWFDLIVALQAPDGSLPESLETPDIRRTDIIAQALRVAIFLQHLTGQPLRYQEANQKFAMALCARVRKDGSLGFTAGSTGGANVWSAMFAEQALRLYAADVVGQPLPFSVEDLV